MALTFSLDQNGVLFRVKLIDCISDTPFDTDDVDTVSIIFYKHNGESFSKVAELKEDDTTAGEFYITYQNTFPEESILDLRGQWEYSGAAVLKTTSDNLQTSQRQVFWVV